MRRSNEIGSQELRWVQPSVRQSAYELRAGDEVVAALRWHKACGSLADATTEARDTLAIRAFGAEAHGLADRRPATR